MTYVQTIYYDTINCVKRIIATEPERIYGKDSSIVYYSRLVNHLGSESPFFRDELPTVCRCAPRRKAIVTS